MNWYYSGFPYSDELYHHGIKNQKWGLRRYQNEDGSLTALGRIHYGVGKAAKVVGSGASKAGQAIGASVKKRMDYRAQKRKDKHPWMMTDEELKNRLARINAENTFREAKNKNRSELVSRGRKVVLDIAETSAKTIASKGIEAFTKKVFGEKAEAVRELADVLADSTATISQIQNAEKRFDIQQKFKKAENMKRTYENEDTIDVNKLSREELDNLNAWKKSRDSATGKPKPSQDDTKAKKEQSSRKQDATNKESESSLEKARQQQRDAQRDLNRKNAQEVIAARKAEAQRRSDERTKRLSEIRRTAETNAQNRLTTERKREVEQLVENIFRNARIRNADYKDSMTQLRKTAEFNVAKRRALQLAEEGSKITVSELFFDGNIDG
jgi:acyl carrier protein